LSQYDATVRIGRSSSPAGTTPTGLEGKRGDGSHTPVPGFEPPAGATDAGGTHHWHQARPSLSARNLVPSPDLIRISTVRRPSFCASPSTLRMSVGEPTFLPAASRMTSPVFSPCSAPT